MIKKVRRLFAGFQPLHYDVTLEPNPKTMVSTGEVVIGGQKNGRPSQRLTLHAQELKITGAEITRHDKKGDHQIEIARINLQKRFHEVRLHTASLLYPGRYTVRLNFEGQITRQMEGIYPCFFKHDGQDKLLIASQFESHHARSAFPCIDEPEAKATFKLTLITPGEDGEVVLSNTPIEKQEKAKGLEPRTKSGSKLLAGGSKLRTTFETTPKMSTYLLAFVFGQMGYKEVKTRRGVVVRAYATPDNVQYLDFGVDFAAKCLDFYEDYFGIPYPLAKCDFVAQPDFASGAMENWGLITAREQGLVVDPANSSLPMRQYTAMVIAHELAHQWFGDLVTMRWWTDLWLNEGFATWMSYLPIDYLHPEWEIWTQFVVDEEEPALKLDALANTHPIEVPIHDPEEIRTIFDAISYEKGASSIHMLEQYLGAETFRDSIRHYLKTHAYGNTDTRDLWQAMEDVSGKPVGEFMSSWTKQPGYPLVRVNVTDHGVQLSQEQFLINPLERSRQPLVEALWPLALRSESDLPELFDQAEANYPKPKGDRILKLNRGQSSFFRTVYNASHLEKLGEAVASGHFSPEDRLGLLSDAFETAKAGFTDTTVALKLLESYRQEHDNAVWDIIAANLSAIRRMMDDEALREDMKPYIRGLVELQRKRLGWEEIEGESYFDKLLRPTILSLASVAEETSVVDEALSRFKRMKTLADLPPDLRGVILTTAARHGDAKTFDRLLKLHNESASSEDKLSLTAALTAFQQPSIIKLALARIKTDDVRLQDVVYWLVYSFSNRYAQGLTWQWLTKNWSWFKDNLGGDLSFARLPLYAARGVSDASFLPAYKAFFESVMSPLLERSFKQGVELLEWQSEWKKRDLKLVKAFFAQKLTAS